MSESNKAAMHSEPPAPVDAPRRAPTPFRVLLLPLRLPMAGLRGIAAFRAALPRWSARLPESRADRALVLATLAAIILVGAATVAVMRSTPAEDLSFDAPTLVATAEPAVTSTTTAPPITTTIAPAATPAPAPRTQPAAPPRQSRAPTPIVQVGEIRIPRIGLVHKIYEGVTLTVIDQGPGHWPGSAMPGQLGNAVFAGHRVTHSHPFKRLNELVTGDEITFQTNDGVFTYTMTEQEIVTPRDVHIVNPTPDATLTLFACHPPGSARQRIVVRGVLASSTPA